jgi:hypothetical protein
MNPCNAPRIIFDLNKISNEEDLLDVRFRIAVADLDTQQIVLQCVEKKYEPDQLRMLFDRVPGFEGLWDL